jgi:hypothetical protein
LVVKPFDLGQLAIVPARSLPPLRGSTIGSGIGK